ncbi:hypothetical protein E3Q16_02868 [Wallemia mellicola]|nr:hypothetical protein E3Q24_03370 [Wallemia mellicola]TIC04045.1 hypothetical protein E3Q16_02868 [Wallemia mellicola]TIC21494.1 hypothetical protein E3Q12_03385 [Wallemia mellicola]TIC54093.1 hypothetical protein E3Q04_02888 [Wallemia mellicola]
MKYSALLIAATAAVVTANPNLFVREAEFNDDAAQECLQNQCQSLNSKINQDCLPIIGGVDSDTDLGNQQAISYYSCICDAMSSASSDCKSCLSSAGEDIDQEMGSVCDEVKTMTTSTPAGTSVTTNTQTTDSNTSPAPSQSANQNSGDSDDDDSSSLQAIPSFAMSITYECILLGTFDVGLLDKVKNKLRVNCDKNYDLKSHEIVFSVSAGPNTTNGRMVMRRDALDERAKWNAIRMFRAEPALLIRSTIDFELENIDTSIPFIQSLGYAYNHEFTKRGEAYIYNDTIVSVYQLYNSNDEIVHAQNVWMAEVRSLPVIPDQSASIDPLNIAISNCLKLKQTLKPLIQLKRVEH